MPHNMKILYCRLPYFRVSNSALFSTWYFSTLISHKRSLDTFYSAPWQQIWSNISKHSHYLTVRKPALKHHCFFATNCGRLSTQEERPRSNNGIYQYILSEELFLLFTNYMMFINEHTRGMCVGPHIFISTYWFNWLFIILSPITWTIQLQRKSVVLLSNTDLCATVHMSLTVLHVLYRIALAKKKLFNNQRSMF